jgi:hypothetical protein
MRALALIALLFAASAHAQLRTIPPDAARAKMSHVQDRVVELDGKRELLAPGAQIRDGENRVIVPSALPSDSLVKYRRDPSGAVRQVWILTPAEAAQR